MLKFTLRKLTKIRRYATHIQLYEKRVILKVPGLKIDPLGRSTVTAGKDHCFCTCRTSVRTSVPTFQNLAKQNKAKTMFATGETMGLAEWIVDDTCLVLFGVKSRNPKICDFSVLGYWRMFLHTRRAFLFLKVLLLRTVCEK